MRDVIYLLFQLLTTLAKLLRPSGGRTVIAENLILKQQLIIHRRSRQRAPNLSTLDRALLGFWSLLLNHRRIPRSAIIIKPSTLLRFHTATSGHDRPKYLSSDNDPLFQYQRWKANLRVLEVEDPFGAGWLYSKRNRRKQDRGYQQVPLENALSRAISISSGGLI